MSADQSGNIQTPQKDWTYVLYGNKYLLVQCFYLGRNTAELCISQTRQRLRLQNNLLKILNYLYLQLPIPIAANPGRRSDHSPRFPTRPLCCWPRWGSWSQRPGSMRVGPSPQASRPSPGQLHRIHIFRCWCLQDQILALERHGHLSVGRRLSDLSQVWTREFWGSSWLSLSGILSLLFCANFTNWHMGIGLKILYVYKVEITQ